MYINEETMVGGGSRVWISQNAYYDDDLTNWYANDDSKDSFLIEMVDSATDEGYISVQHSPRTYGVISWTEVFRMNHDGSVLLNKVASLPDAPGADIFKMFADDYLGRLIPKMRTASETVNILQGVGTSRVFRQSSFPGSPKDGDILFKPGVQRLRYGEIYARDNSTVTTITIQNTFYQVTIFDTDGESNDTTPSNADDHIEIDHDGIYLIIVSAAIETEGAGTGDAYEGVVYKNNGATALPNLHFHRVLAGGGGDIGSVSMSGIASLVDGDTIELWVRNTSGTDNIIFEDVTLSVIEIK
jgi:hypothetical protein